MITLCWAAKGGSGTSVVAAALALSRTTSTLLVDLDGDQPTVFGVPEPPGPGLLDWVVSTAPVDRIRRLEVEVTSLISILPTGSPSYRGPATAIADDGPRWRALADVLTRDDRHVIVDVGTAAPPDALYRVADHRWLVTRPCYLALRSAQRLGRPPSGIVLITEPGRSLRRSDVEASIGAPVVLELPSDPAVARAVDTGLLVSRLPRLLRHELRAAA
jgi:hypothetical protein